MNWIDPTVNDTVIAQLIWNRGRVVQWLNIRPVGGSIPSRVKQNTLKFKVLLFCLAFST